MAFCSLSSGYYIYEYDMLNVLSQQAYYVLCYNIVLYNSFAFVKL